MRVFLCYASAHKELADAIHLRLRSDGHDVFFDRSSLSAASEFDRHIDEELAASSLLVFLVSPESVAPGSYCLTELKLARQRWPHPEGRVLAVRIADTALDGVPAYLKAVTMLAPDGNTPAEVAAEVRRIARARRRRLLERVLLAVGLCGVIGIGVVAAKIYHQSRSVVEPALDAGVTATQSVVPLDQTIRHRARAAVAVGREFVLATAEPGQVGRLRTDGQGVGITADLPGDPVAVAAEGSTWWVATRTPERMVQVVDGVSHTVEPVPSRAPRGSDRFATTPVSLAVVRGDVWLLTAEDGAASVLWRRGSDGKWTSPEWQDDRDLAFDLTSMTLTAVGDRVYGVTTTTPHYLYRFSADRFERWSGHDHGDTIGTMAAITQAPTGDVLGFASAFTPTALVLRASGEIELTKRFPSAADLYAPEQWDGVALTNAGERLVASMTRYQRGDSYTALESRIAVTDGTGNWRERATLPSVEIAQLAVDEASDVALILTRTVPAHSFDAFTLRLDGDSVRR